MPTAVENASYLDQIGPQDVIDGERKPTNQGATQCAVHETPRRRHVANKAEGAVELRLELLAQPRTFSFVPRKSLRDIRRGFRPELEPIRHGRLRSCSLPRTSSQVSPGPGAGLSRRRSSSSLCQSGTGTSSGVTARLSQMSSSNLSRSSAGSR